MLAPATLTPVSSLVESIEGDPQALAAMAKAAADPLRLLILRALRDDSLGVLELCRIFDVHQPTLSHHLKVLSNAALIGARREGNHLFYRRLSAARETQLQHLQEGILAAVDTINLSPLNSEALAQVRRERSQNSLNFFRNNAHKFREQQDLIASHNDYGSVVAGLLRQAVEPERCRQGLEVGPGDGAFLSELAPLCESLLALDNSPEMLERTRRYISEHQLDNVRCLLGDTSHPELNALQADVIVVNMVLHHIASPAGIFADVVRTLAPGGTLLVTDLCRHDQDWAQSSCGDLWLGFEPEELLGWANAAGLVSAGSELLAQRNGFQIQIHLFRHAH